MSEWKPFDPRDFEGHEGLHRGYLRCFALRVRGNAEEVNLESVWAQIVPPYRRGQILPIFPALGVSLEVRMIRQWNGKTTRNPDPSEEADVQIIRYDSTGHLIADSHSTRMVYSNSHGRYIKVAGRRIPLTIDRPPKVYFRGRKPVPPRRTL